MLWGIESGDVKSPQKKWELGWMDGWMDGSNCTHFNPTLTFSSVFVIVSHEDEGHLTLSCLPRPELSLKGSTDVKICLSFQEKKRTWFMDLFKM